MKIKYIIKFEDSLGEVVASDAGTLAKVIVGEKKTAAANLF